MSKGKQDEMCPWGPRDRAKAMGRSYTETDFELNNMKIVLMELSIGGMNCLKSL